MPDTAADKVNRTVRGLGLLMRLCAYCGFPAKPGLEKRHHLGWPVCGVCLSKIRATTAQEGR